MNALLSIVLVGLIGLSLGQEAATQTEADKQQQLDPKLAERQYPMRDLPADSLRDFPGVCFGSTTYEFYQIGQSWPLTPFCGRATCLTDGRHLIERVNDCGLLPKKNPKCKVVNEADAQKPFPSCCPKFECEEGAQLEYPTVEELRQIAETAARQQFQGLGAAGGPGPVAGAGPATPEESKSAPQ